MSSRKEKLCQDRESKSDDKDTLRPDSMADTDCLDPVSSDAMTKRCNWVLNNPDIVVMLHAIRVELLVKYVMPYIVPPDSANPFQYWLRFEFGQSGNPHAHGLAYVNGNPQFDLIVKDQETFDKLRKENHPDLDEIRLEEDAVRDVADFYDDYVREMHPCKDTCGKAALEFRGAALHANR